MKAGRRLLPPAAQALGTTNIGPTGALVVCGCLCCTIALASVVVDASDHEGVGAGRRVGGACTSRLTPQVLRVKGEGPFSASGT